MPFPFIRHRAVSLTGVLYFAKEKQCFIVNGVALYRSYKGTKTSYNFFTQEDVTTFIELSKIEKSNIRKINSSIFEFEPLPDLLFALSSNWYEDQKVIATLSKYFVRSKSEMNIANIL